MKTRTKFEKLSYEIGRDRCKNFVTFNETTTLAEHYLQFIRKSVDFL